MSGFGTPMVQFQADSHRDGSSVAQKDSALARYALEGLPNKVMAAEYRTALPDEKLIAGELERARKMLEVRKTRNTREGKRHE